MSGENSRIEKIKKSSRIALVVANVTKILVIVGAVACIVGGIASWCVVNIFEYGCELQRQSDETL